MAVRRTRRPQRFLAGDRRGCTRRDQTCPGNAGWGAAAACRRTPPGQKSPKGQDAKSPTGQDAKMPTPQSKPGPDPWSEAGHRRSPRKPEMAVLWALGLWCFGALGPWAAANQPRPCRASSASPERVISRPRKAQKGESTEWKKRGVRLQEWACTCLLRVSPAGQADFAQRGLVSAPTNV